MTHPTGDALAANERVVHMVAAAIYNDDFEGDPSQAFEDRDDEIIAAYISNARAAISAYLKAMATSPSDGEV